MLIIYKSWGFIKLTPLTDNLFCQHSNAGLLQAIAADLTPLGRQDLPWVLAWLHLPPNPADGFFRR